MSFLEEYIQGYTNKHRYSVYLEGKKYAIIKLAGGSFWSGLHGTTYCSPFYTLIKKGHDGWHGFSKHVHDGRLKKEDKIKLRLLLDQAEKEKWKL